MQKYREQYKIFQNGNIFQLTSDIELDKLKLFCQSIAPKISTFIGLYTLQQLQELNPNFYYCSNIYEAQKLINERIEQNQINILNFGTYLDLLIFITDDNSQIKLKFYPIKNYIESIQINNNNLNSPKKQIIRENLTLILSPKKNNSYSGNSSPITNINNFNYPQNINSPISTNYSNSPTSLKNENVLSNNNENEQLSNQNDIQIFNSSEQNKNLYAKINIIENENKNLREKIEQMNNKINEFSSKNQYYYSSNNNILSNMSQNIENLKAINEKLIYENNLFKKQINQINNEKIIYDDSNVGHVEGTILKNNEEIEFLSKKIGENSDKVIFNLIYKATENSDKAQAFHERCDQAKNTLVLIETSENRRFGGFTTCDWSGNQIEKNDENAFVFSLDKMKIYDIVPGQPAIACYPNYGPIFLNCQIKINDDAFTNGGSTFCKGQNYQTEEDFELNGGNQDFQIKEIEVYEIELGNPL